MIKTKAWLRNLYYAAAALLAFSGTMKVILLSSKRLDTLGWIFESEIVPMWTAIAVSVALEVLVVGYIFFSKSPSRATALLALFGAFTAFRTVNFIYDFKVSCGCLGAFPQLLGLGQGGDRALTWAIFWLFALLTFGIARLEFWRAGRQA